MFAIIVLIVGFTLAVGVNYQGLTDYLVSVEHTPKFQALNVIGLAVTLLSELLAVYGFY